MRSSFQHFMMALMVLTSMAMVHGQPVPVEGTEMVPNEHGGQFPREIIWESDGSKMVLIPHGTFTMGLSQTRGGSGAEEPEREVYLPSFYIDKYEVSNRKYSRYVEKASAQRPRPTGNPTLTHPDHPVCGVTWDSALSYARWTGRELPTEAMWEKAARGPNNNLFTTGNSAPSMERVVYGRGSFGETVPVDKPTSDVSGYGVYHMGGNVSEWVSDWYEREYYKGAPTDNPKGPETGMSKVYRGASFLSTEEQVRVTRRMAALRTQIRDELGFRTVWVPATPREVAQNTPPPPPP
ncbi:MAG: SUMF1/EgtB/PvdO family nonheme iron enzyme, partial [Candidatus Sumerlaeia bacterium]|nr:SUMF1/EgtB/PvdO family nonheme iron enzyme [Candidatus Sumerlaeia bacterium]